MVFFMATILGDVQYTHFMGHLPIPDTSSFLWRPAAKIMVSDSPGKVVKIEAASCTSWFSPGTQRVNTFRDGFFFGNLKTASGLLKYECGVSIDVFFFFFSGNMIASRWGISIIN